jgi:hypothetical protein
LELPLSLATATTCGTTRRVTTGAGVALRLAGPDFPFVAAMIPPFGPLPNLHDTTIVQDWLSTGFMRRPESDHIRPHYADAVTRQNPCPFVIPAKQAVSNWQVRHRAALALIG